MFISKNELSNFDFHDAEVTSAKFAGADFIWHISDFHAAKENSQNEHEYDMSIEKAVIIFRSAKIDRIILETYRDSRALAPEESEETPPEDYPAMFDTSHGDRINIGGMADCRENSDGTFSARFEFAMAARRNFAIDLTFAESVVQWEDFSGLAWYELPVE